LIPWLRPGLARPHPLLRYAISVGTTALAFVLTLLIRPLISQTPFALFFLAVIASAWYGGLSAGLLSTTLSVVLVNIFLLPPVGSFSLEGLIQLTIVALTAVIMSFLTAGRRRVEDDLREQRERYAVTLSSIGDGVIATDAQGRITFLNPVAEALTGWPQTEANGRPIVEIFRIVNADSRQTVEDPVTRVLREGQIVGLANHTLLLDRDGVERPVDDSGAPIRDRDGNIVGVVMVFRDITDHAAAETLLARYQLLSENARDIILFFRADGRILEANNAALAAYGYTHAELLSMSIYDLRDPTTVQDVAEKLARASAEGILFETRHRRKDGSILVVEVNSRGAPLGGEQILLSIVRDITRRKQNEERQQFLADAGKALASSLDYQTRLDAIAQLAVPRIADWCAIDIVGDDSSVSQLVVAHVDPAKVAWARELRQRFPPDPDAPQGVPNVIRTGQTEFIPEITDDMLRATVSNAQQLEIALMVGFTSVIIAPLTARDRTLGAITFVTAESGRRYDAADVALAEELARRAAIAIDNARLYAAEQQARAEAEAAVRLRDQFLSIAAHELKTPLTTLLGNAQLMLRRAQRDSSLPERELRQLRMINEQSSRLHRMVLALLDISRLESGQLSIERAPLDLVALTHRVVEEIRPASDGRAIEIVGPAEPLLVAGDELRLEQVLQNLIQNALKYSPDGQPVVVWVERRSAHATVAVTDHGIGIPAAALPRLFGRFYRAPNAEAQQIGGMGVGLYVVKEIVTLHGGEIAVESAEGQGSTFTVLLPLLHDTIEETPR
jgi:PAS domain S-box-containing protein